MARKHLVIENPSTGEHFVYVGSGYYMSVPVTMAKLAKPLLTEDDFENGVVPCGYHTGDEIRAKFHR